MTRKAKATPVADDQVTEVTETEAPAEVTFSAKDLAAELGIDAKSFRRWLRAHTKSRANKGGRWSFDTESKAAFIEAYKAKGSGTSPELDDSEVAELDEVDA